MTTRALRQSGHHVVDDANTSITDPRRSQFRSCTQRHDTGERCDIDAAMSKLLASETAMT